MYHNILVPVIFDHDHDAAEPVRLAGLLAAPDAKITFLHVIEQIPAYVATQIPVEVRQKLRAELKDDLEKLAKRVPGATGQLVEGHSGRTILDYANQYGIDLIIIESHRPGLEDYFLGSTAGHVVRHAGCSVHVVR